MILGAEFEELDKALLKKLEIKSGVKVNKIYAEKLRKYTQMREGFIITHIDGKVVKGQRPTQFYIKSYQSLQLIAYVCC